MTLYYARNMPHGQISAKAYLFINFTQDQPKYRELNCYLLYFRITLVTVLLRHLRFTKGKKNLALGRAYNGNCPSGKTFTLAARAFVSKQMPISIITKFSLVRVKLVIGTISYYLIKSELLVRNDIFRRFFLHVLGNFFGCP